MERLNSIDMTRTLLSEHELEALKADMRAAARLADRWLCERRQARPGGSCETSGSPLVP